MKDKLVDTIEKYGMLDFNDNIVLGLSGGVDSMALLYLLLEIKDRYGIKLHLAHVNHGVRGELALRDQEFTRGVARKLGLPFYTTKVDMDGYAKAHKITSEEAGRILRYGFFNSIIRELGQGKIAVAHNLNDQAETLIMRFLRGTGLDGLRGIEHVNGNIIRPILDLDRDELEEYIEVNEIPIIEDHTNFQPIYTRNKIRLEIIPYIQEHFNPNIIRTLERTARLAEIDSDFLEKTSENRYNEIVKKEEKFSVTLDLDKFRSQDLSIKQRVIRRCILRINSDLQGISESQINLIVDLFNQGETGKKVSIARNIFAEVSYSNLIVGKNKDLGQADFDYSLVDGLVVEEIGYRFKLRELDGPIDFKLKKTARYFDLDQLEGDLRIRNRRAGDSFRPFGMKGSKKIKDYFIDEKIPRNQRDIIPLLVDGSEILWVVGYRTSEKFKITRSSKRILEVDYEKIT